MVRIALQDAKMALLEITEAYTDSGNRMSAYELAERMYRIAADALEPLPKP